MACTFFAVLPILAACGAIPGSEPPTTHRQADGDSQALSDHTPISRNYFGGNEQFCARPPLSGTISYSASRGTATLHVHVRGLPSTTQVAINWANGTGRAYVVASVDTDGPGSSVQSSVLLYRPGEVRGTRIILTGPDVQASVLGSLFPCT